jgi:DNA replication protein DnaC
MSRNKDPKSKTHMGKTTSDDLRRQLQLLKLPFMLEHFEALAQKAGSEQWSHVAFLTRLIEGEAAGRQDRACQRRIKNARFPVIKTLQQFDFTWPTKINRPAIQNLFRLKFIEDKANAILIGGVGLGKTHLATSLGLAACHAGPRVRFATAIDIINSLLAAQKVGRLAQKLKEYIRPELLIIDELGYLPIDQRGADLLFQIISQRYERGSIVLTTNKVYKHWSSMFNNDSTLTSAILDRVLHHAETIIIEGESYRMKDRIEP